MRVRTRTFASVVIGVAAAALIYWSARSGRPEELSPGAASLSAKKVEEALDKLPALSLPASSGPFELPNGLTGWAVQLEGGHPIATPAVADGKVYVGGGFGSYDLYAIDAATGREVWRVRTTDDGPTGAVVAGDVVVFNTESCTLEVRSKRDGALVWGRWLGDPLMSQPAVAEGRVAVCYPNAGSQADTGPVTPGTVGRGTLPATGAGSHALGAFDLATGRALWAHAVPADCLSAPVIANGTVHATTLDGTLTQIDLATGRLISQEQRNATSAPWISQTDKSGARSEAIVSQRESQQKTVDGKPTEVHSEGLRRIDSKTGRMSEEKQLFGDADYLAQSTVEESKYYTAPMKQAADQAVGFAAPPPQANLGAATANLGISKVVDAWSYEGSRPLVTKERLHTAQGNKVTSASRDGKEVAWEVTYKPEVKERLLSPPAAAGDQIVFTALDGAVFSLDGRSGALRHAFRFEKRIASQPAVMDGRIFVGTLDGWLIAIDTKDRSLDGWSMWGGGPAHNGAEGR